MNGAEGREVTQSDRCAAPPPQSVTVSSGQPERSSPGSVNQIQETPALKLTQSLRLGPG